MILKSNLKKLGFSFVELIIGISISMILMISVTVFVQTGIKNLIIQKQIIENGSEIKDFTKSFYSNLDSSGKNLTGSKTSSGIFWRTLKIFDNGGFSYLGEKSFSGFFCNGSGANPTTNHLIFKNFIPFEGEGGDIFLGKNFSKFGINTNIFSGEINYINQIALGPTGVALGVGNNLYISDTISNQILLLDKTNIANTKKIIAGKGIFGDNFSNGEYGTGVFLNNPTGLSYGNIGGTGYLFISDTLNDRILYLNTTTNKIYKLLGREDGLSEPTGIYYDNLENTLYISNSGKGEIISYSSSGSFINSLNISIKPRKSAILVKKLRFDFIFESGGINPTIISPTNTGSFNFNLISSGEDLLEKSGNSLTYHFVDYFGPETIQLGCAGLGYKMIGLNPVKCTKFGSGIIGNYRNNNFVKGIDYGINIGNISGINFLNTGSYYIKTNFYDGSILKDSYYSSYFTKSDNDFFSKGGNILKILTGGLGYPTGIYKNGSNLVINDFLKRKTIEIDKNGNYISDFDLSNFNFENLAINKNKDIILKTPISSYDFSILNNMINIYIKYFDNYSCYGDNAIISTKEIIFKKSIK